MKRAAIISFLLNGLLLAVLPILYDAYKDINAKRKAEIQAKNTQIIKRNEILNRFYDEKAQLIEEKEECITTQRIILENKRSQIATSNEIINEYENLFDSVSEIVIGYERKERELPRLNPSWD